MLPMEKLPNFMTSIIIPKLLMLHLLSLDLPPIGWQGWAPRTPAGMCAMVSSAVPAHEDVCAPRRRRRDGVSRSFLSYGPSRPLIISSMPETLAMMPATSLAVPDGASFFLL